MAYDPAVLAAIQRCNQLYNGDRQTASNPGGMDGDGHTENFIPALRDVATIGAAIGSIVLEMQTVADKLPEMRQIRDDVDADRIAAQQAAAAAQQSAELVDGPGIAAGILRARRVAFFYSNVR